MTDVEKANGGEKIPLVREQEDGGKLRTPPSDPHERVSSLAKINLVCIVQSMGFLSVSPLLSTPPARAAPFRHFFFFPFAIVFLSNRCITFPLPRAPHHWLAKAEPDAVSSSPTADAGGDESGAVNEGHSHDGPPPSHDAGDTLFGVKLGYDGVFATLAVLTIVLISASCYFEEWMYKQLPGFNYFWTVALAELFMFSVMSVGGAACNGTLGQPRKAPLALYAVQATVMAVYAAVAKIAYKYLNYATGTVLRSTKLVFVMAISVVWLGRKYSRWDYAAALFMISSVGCFGLGEAKSNGGEDHTMGYVLSVLGLGLAALQTNMADNAMRDYGASTLENMLYVNVMGLFIVAVMAAYVDGEEALHYMMNTHMAAVLLGLRSVTFYFGALVFTELTRHSGATPATSVATARKCLTVVGSFVFFPGDKPLSVWFGAGIVLFICAIGLELKSRQEKKKK